MQGDATILDADDMPAPAGTGQTDTEQTGTRQTGGDASLPWPHAALRLAALAALSWVPLLALAG